LAFLTEKVEYEPKKYIEIVQFEVDDDTKLNSLEIAKKKAPYTMKMSVSGFERSEKRHINNLWQGKIADKKTMQWLESQGFHIEEYDQIRTDNFRKPDIWDLTETLTDIEIEVRSSCLASQAHNMAHVVSNYKLLGPYTIPGFKESERAKFLHIQVIYPFIQSTLNQRLEAGEKVQGYIMGWISRDELFKKGFDWNYQETHYKVIFLKDAFEMAKVPVFLKSLPTV
jgi:hypothetical protein